MAAATTTTIITVTQLDAIQVKANLITFCLVFAQTFARFLGSGERFG